MSDSERLDKLSRSSRRSAVIGALGLLVFLGSLVFGSVQLEAVSDELGEKRAQLDSLQDVVISTEQKILRQRQALDSLRFVKQEIFEELSTIDASRAQRTVQTAIDSLATRRQAPQVYIHIAREEQRPAAREVQAILEQAGMAVQGIERVNRAPRTPQLRIFRDAEQSGARAIQQLLAAQGYRFSLENLTRAYGKKDLSWLRPGHFELWFGSAPDAAAGTPS